MLQCESLCNGKDETSIHCTLYDYVERLYTVLQKAKQIFPVCDLADIMHSKMLALRKEL